MLYFTSRNTIYVSEYLYKIITTDYNTIFYLNQESVFYNFPEESIKPASTFRKRFVKTTNQSLALTTCSTRQCKNQIL